MGKVAKYLVERMTVAELEFELAFKNFNRKPTRKNQKTMHDKREIMTDEHTLIMECYGSDTKWEK